MRCRGLTLLELIISSAVMAVVLTVAATLIVSALTSWSRGIEKADAENSVLAVVRKMVQDLDLSDQNSLVLFAPNAGETPQGNASWLTDLFTDAVVWSTTQIGQNSGVTLAPTSIPTAGTGNGMSFLDPMPAQPKAVDPKFGLPIWHHHDLWYLGADSDPSSLTGQAVFYKATNLAHYDDRYSKGGSRLVSPDQYQLGPAYDFSLPGSLSAMASCSNDPATKTLQGATRVLKNVTKFIVFAPVRNTAVQTNFTTALPLWANPVMIHLEVLTPHGTMQIDTSTCMRQNDDLQPAVVVGTDQQP